MEERLFYKWLRKCTKVKDPVDVARIKAYFESQPGIDEILTRAVAEHLGLSGIGKLIQQGGATVGSSQTPPPSPQTLPAKKPSLLDKFKTKFGKKPKPQAGIVDNEPKRRINWKVIGIGVGVLILIIAAIIVLPRLGGSSGSYGAYDSVPTSYDSGLSGSAPDEAMPVLRNPNPLNFRHSDWLKPLQFLILAEAIGILIALLGDAFFRKQWTDAVVAILVAATTIFLVVPATVPIYFAVAWFLVLQAIVFLVSFLGGRDFTPVTGYHLLIGVVGGLIVTQIQAFQGMTHLASAPVLPLTQLAVVFQLMDWKALIFPLVVYAYIVVGTVFAFIEAFRPSEDKTPRWGSIAAAAIGLAFYFGLLYLAHLAPWLSYLVAFSISIALSALSQNERAIRLITDKWGVRSSFDGAILVTAVLLIVHIIFGVVG